MLIESFFPVFKVAKFFSNYCVHCWSFNYKLLFLTHFLEQYILFTQISCNCGVCHYECLLRYLQIPHVIVLYIYIYFLLSEQMKVRVCECNLQLQFSVQTAELSKFVI